MDQTTQFGTAQQPAVDTRPIESKKVRIADIVVGQIVDKRRVGIHPDRIEQALQGVFPELAAAIHETGEYVVVMSSITLEDAKILEAFHSGQTYNSMQIMPAGGQLAQLNAFGHFGRMALNGQPLSFTIFSGLGGEGLHIALNPTVFNGQQHYGESAIINLALQLLEGDTNRPIGFSKAAVK